MAYTANSKDVCTLAGLADVDPRTAARWLRGEDVRGRPAVRLEDAAAKLGLRRAQPPQQLGLERQR